MAPLFASLPVREHGMTRHCGRSVDGEFLEWFKVGRVGAQAHPFGAFFQALDPLATRVRWFPRNRTHLPITHSQQLPTPRATSGGQAGCRRCFPEPRCAPKPGARLLGTRRCSRFRCHLHLHTLHKAPLQHLSPHTPLASPGAKLPFGPNQSAARAQQPHRWFERSHPARGAASPHQHARGAARASTGMRSAQVTWVTAHAPGVLMTKGLGSHPSRCRFWSGP